MQIKLLRAALHGELQGSKQLVLMAMNAAGRQQAHYVDGIASCNGAINGLQIGRILKKFTGLDGAINFCD